MKNLFAALVVAGSAVALPAQNPTTPTPVTTSTPPTSSPSPLSCMEKGKYIKEWTVENFDFHASYIFSTPAHQNSWGYTNFTLTNPVLDYKPICSAASNQLQDFFYGTMVYQCEVPEEHATDGATFTFNRPTGELQINQTWACVDEGGRFTAEGGTTLDLDCTETSWQNPDWEVGQIYSTRDITCTPVTQKAPVETLSAIL